MSKEEKQGWSVCFFIDFSILSSAQNSPGELWKEASWDIGDGGGGSSGDLNPPWGLLSTCPGTDAGLSLAVLQDGGFIQKKQGRQSEARMCCARLGLFK